MEVSGEDKDFAVLHAVGFFRIKTELQEKIS
jgi:hypothetical protein